MKYILLAGTIIMLAVGQVMFKYAASDSGPDRWSFLTKPIFLLALVLYAFATLSWMLTLKLWPITIAYPATAIAIVLVMIAGVFVFGETPSRMQLAGAAVILSGVLLMSQ